jgi:transposase
LDDILVFFQVRLAFLPAYSPELNPCELVFSLIKQDIRNLMVTREHLQAWYLHCLYPKVILPDLTNF